MTVYANSALNARIVFSDPAAAQYFLDGPGDCAYRSLMNIMAIGGKSPRSFSRSSAGLAAGLSLLLLFAFAMAGCGPGNDATNATSPASPSTSAAPAPTPPPMRPQAELAAAFDASTETIFEARTATDLAKMKVERDATLSAAPNGLKVTATGNGPHLYLPPLAEGKQFILQIVIDSPAETPIKLFYSRREHPTLSEDQAQTLGLKKGRNVVYFQLDQANLIDPLRLDPGTSTGDYIIESIVARAVTKPATP
jgi:hypothetical protein